MQVRLRPRKTQKLSKIDKFRHFLMFFRIFLNVFNRTTNTGVEHACRVRSPYLLFLFVPKMTNFVFISGSIYLHESLKNLTIFRQAQPPWRSGILVILGPWLVREAVDSTYGRFFYVLKKIKKCQKYLKMTNFGRFLADFG